MQWVNGRNSEPFPCILLKSDTKTLRHLYTLTPRDLAAQTPKHLHNKGGSTHFQLGGWGPRQRGWKIFDANVAHNHRPPQVNF